MIMSKSTDLMSMQQKCRTRAIQAHYSTCRNHDFLSKRSKGRQWLTQLFLFSQSCRCRGLSKRGLHVLWVLVQRRASTAPVLSTLYGRQLRGVSLMRLRVTIQACDAKLHASSHSVTPQGRIVLAFSPASQRIQTEAWLWSLQASIEVGSFSPWVLDAPFSACQSPGRASIAWCRRQAG